MSSYGRSGRERGGRAGLKSGAGIDAKVREGRLFGYVASVGIDMDLRWGVGTSGSASGFSLGWPLVGASLAFPVNGSLSCSG